MIIRQATQYDIDSIVKLLDSVQVNKKDPNLSKKTTGLLEYTKNSHQLMGLINPYFLVADDNGIRGTVIACEDFLFRNHHWETSNARDEYIIKNIDSHFVYLDILAVPQYEGLGSGRIADALYSGVEKKAIENKMPKIIGFIRHKPFLNSRSKSFAESKGFNHILDIKVDNGALGFYQKDLKQ